jgi:hypothetical protein
MIVAMIVLYKFFILLKCHIVLPNNNVMSMCFTTNLTLHKLFVLELCMENIKNWLQRYWDYFVEWWYTGKYAKIITVVGVLVFLGVLIIVILLAAALISGGQSIITDLNKDPNLVSKDSLTAANRIERVGNTNLGNFQTFWLEGKDTLYFDYNSKLVYNNNVVSSSPTFSPLSIFSAGEQFLINEYNKTTAFSPLVNAMTVINNVSNLTPITGEGSNYFYIPVITDTKVLEAGGVGSTFQIKKATDITTLKDASTIENLKPILKVGFPEFKKMNGRDYIFFWEKEGRQGNLEIWVYNDAKKFEAVTTIDAIEEIKITNNGIVYRKSIGANKTTLETVVFEGKNLFGTLYKLDDLAQKVKTEGNVLGTINAFRCTINKDVQVLCLVKNNDSAWSDDRYKDEIIKLDFKGGKFTKEYTSVKVAGRSLHYSVDNQLYAVVQTDKQLYKLK